MNTTPLWVPLVVAGLGLFGTAVAGLGGVWLTQRRADRREELNWTREQEQERERRAREDKARTVERRREAYIDFYTVAKDHQEATTSYYSKNGRGEVIRPPNEAREMHTAYRAVELYGSPRVMSLARDAIWALMVLRRNIDDYDDTKQALAQGGAEAVAAEMALRHLLAGIREDLEVPDGPFAEPVP